MRLRRLVPFIAVLALLAAACPDGGKDQAGSTPSPADGGVGEDGQQGDGGQTSGQTYGPAKVTVSPDPPAPGEPTAVRFHIEGQGADAHEQRSDPLFLLARSSGEAGRAQAPVPGPLEVLRGWDRYPGRALVAVLAAPQPDAGHRVAIRAVSVTEGGERITVFARVLGSKGAAAQVISIPWVVVSVRGASTVLARQCILSFDAQPPIRTDCL